MNHKEDNTRAKAKSGVTFKWLLVPLSILTVVAAGGSLSLFEDWNAVMMYQNYSKSTRDWIMVIVGFGYLGSNPGLVSHYLGSFNSYIVAAVLTVVSYMGLGYCSTYAFGGNWHLFFSFLFLYLAAFSSSIAIVTTISETIQNFSRRPGLLYIVVMIVYFLIAYSFEEGLRNGPAWTFKVKWYYPCLGVGIAIIYIISAVLSTQVVIEDFYKRMNISTDLLGML